MATGSSYALDAAWHAERDRLNSITRLYDPQSLHCCDRIGVGEGWRCADIGAGTGSLVELLAERVGPSGQVLALDLDTRFLDVLEAPQIEVRRADVRTEPLPAAHFDLVHARLVLEHLPERGDVLAGMVAAARPGGWVLVEDFDWITAEAVDPPSEVHLKVVRAIRAFFGAHGYNAELGRGLPRRLEEAGLVDVASHAVSIQVRAHREHGVPQWELLAAQLGPGMVQAGLVAEEDLAAFRELWHDGRSVCFAPLMVSVWGRVP